MPQQYIFADEFTDESTELAILKSVSENPKLYQEVASLIPPEKFYSHSDLAEEVFNAIKNKTAIPKIDSSTALDLSASISELNELFKKRAFATTLSNAMFDLKESKSPVSFLSRLKSDVKELNNIILGGNSNSIKPIKNILPQIVKDLELVNETRRKTGSACIGLPTGIKGLDDILGGLQPGLHLLAAPPGLGKTTFSLNMGLHSAKKGNPVIFISFEEQVSRLGFKVVCINASLESKKYFEGYGDLRILQKAISESGSLLNNFFFLEGTSALHLTDIEDRIHQLLTEIEQPKCLVIIDYLQRMAACNSGFNDYRMSVSNLVAEMRQMSMDLDSPVLVISSQNRSGQGGAQLTSLKESGDLEYSADSVIFLKEDRERSLTPPGRSVNAIVEKNRFGDRGTVNLVFRPDLGIFREEATYER